MRGVFLYDIGTIIYALGFVAGLTFVIHYGVTAPWWRSAIGRMFMVIGGAIVVGAGTVLYQIVVASLGVTPFVPRSALELTIRLGGYAVFTVAMGFLVGTYFHERRKPAGTSNLPIRRGEAPGETTTPEERMATMADHAIPSTTAAVIDGQPTTVDTVTGQPTGKPTAKVLAGVITSGGLVVVVAILTAITPDLLGFLGPWAPVGFAGVVALGGFLASYIKRP